jgi:hypothetical protein
VELRLVKPDLRDKNIQIVVNQTKVGIGVSILTFGFFNHKYVYSFFKKHKTTTIMIMIIINNESKLLLARQHKSERWKQSHQRHQPIHQGN